MATARTPIDKPLSLLAWKLLQALAKPYGHPPHTYPGSYPALSEGRDGKFLRLSSRHDDLNASASKAVSELQARNWLVVDEYRNHRLSETGVAAAETTPRPVWTPPAPPAMSDEAWEVLGELKYTNLDASYKQAWARTLDVGGGNGSNHSALLLTLVRHGFAESKQRGSDKIETEANVIPEPILGKRAKGSKLYRVTQKGVDALMARRAEKDLLKEMEAAQAVVSKPRRPKP